MALDSRLSNYSCKVKFFKCFGEYPCGFDGLRHMNVIIGRNNAGKSSLLELIRICIEGNYEVSREQWYTPWKDMPPLFCFKTLVGSQEAQQLFEEGRLGEPTGPYNSYITDFEPKIVGASLEWSARKDGPQFNRLIPRQDGPDPFADFSDPAEKARLGNLLVAAAGNPLHGKSFWHLQADRNVKPERATENLTIASDGSGATNIVRYYKTRAGVDRGLIEKTLLAALNEIFFPDGTFTRIECSENVDQLWEVYLEEEHKGLIALSKSGSGLKTILLVLINLLVVPVISGLGSDQFVYGFEELENNLHPALLRRLLTYVFSHLKRTGAICFLTTHSSITIDFFSKDVDAQIVFVRQIEGKSTTLTAGTYIHNAGILDDLDVRASDLLQANGIIWVEGPSDRIYINRWIALWSDNSLKEGVHYQCVFYGGRLLAHLEATSPDDARSGVAILRMARHACVVMDSDMRTADAPVNDTKRRIDEEIRTIRGLSWITKGREIENYLPEDAFQAWKGWTNLDFHDPYGDVFETINTHEPGLGTRLKKQKPLLAEQIVPHLTHVSCRAVLDLDERMTELCRRIREWNRLSV